MVIKVDGQEMDHRRLAHAETSQFVSPVVDGVKLVNGMPMPGDIATHVEVILPAGAYAGEMSAKFIVTFHQTSPDAKPIDKMGAEISGKWMTTALKTAVIDPALSGFTKQHRNLKVNTKHMSVQIDGHTIDVNAITSTYAKKGQDCVRLKIVLPPDAVEDTSPAFIVDVLAANGDLVASMDAKLNQKWLAKPLLKAIIEPVMQAENILEVGYSKVTVDDHEVAHPETGHTAEHASKQVAVAARVKVHLRPTDRPLKKAIDPTTANPNALSPCTFNVEITLNDEVISASSTRPTIKWMKGKTLLQALVQPAMKAASVGSATIVGLYVEAAGHRRVEADGSRPVFDFLAKSGAVTVEIKLNSKDAFIEQAKHGLAGAMRSFFGSGDSGISQPFIIDIADAKGAIIKSMETELSGKWLGKPLGKALIEPALQAAGHADQGYKSVVIHGKAIDETQKASTFASEVLDEPTRITVHLNGNEEDEKPHFYLEMYDSTGTLISASETQLNKKWLGNPLKKTVDAAVKAAAGGAVVASVEVDGAVVDPSKPASSFLHADGTPATVRVCLS